jgi:hypothetical protein
MADYLLLYRGGSMPETEAEQAKVMQAWTEWFGQLGGAVKDGGNPTSGQASHVGADGAVGGDTLAVSGYSVITAGSLDEATTLAKGCPVLLGGGQIDVHETVEVM